MMREKKMGKIKRRKKMGRPPKGVVVGADLDPHPAQRERDLRRSTRRRSVTYVDDFYDDEDLFLEDEVISEEEEEEEEEEEMGREKKVKGRVGHVSSSEEEEFEDNKPFKKRKIGDEDDDDDEEDKSSSDHDDDNEDRSREEKKGVKINGVVKKLESVQVQGKLSDSSKGVVRLPDKMHLEFILDKLQKKDRYNVYAEPVDPDELPDYHDVIEHPMDFGTVRKKLGNGAYSNLEQFENDVYLICTNAMQYNAPETVYYRQARSIQELAQKKFQRLRIEFENTVTELKSEECNKPNSIVEKPVKKSPCKPIQEPVRSDFSSGATLAAAGHTCTLPNVTQAGGFEKPSTFDAHVDGNSSLTESKPEKTEEQLSGKGFPSKLGRKPFVIDESRRGSYHISNEPVVRTESMCTIFEGENMQLLSVGLHANHSYARSLARFAATLGPVAWKVASRRIEQALPAGSKFGRGWVGEYEPLPTPVLMLENNTQKRPVSIFPAKLAKDVKTAESAKVRASEPLPKPILTIEKQMLRQPSTNSRGAAESRKEKVSEASKVFNNNMQLGLRTTNLSGLTASCKLQDPAKERQYTNSTSDGKLGLCNVPGSKSFGSASYQKRSCLSMDNVKSENMVLKQVQLQQSSSACESPIGSASQKQVEHSSEKTTSRLLETVSRNRNLPQSVPFKQLETNGVARAATYFPHGTPEQCLSDPVQMMRILAERPKIQQKSSNSVATEGAQITLLDPSSRRDDSSSAANAAARAWMTLGAGHYKPPPDSVGSPKMQIAAALLYNPAREIPQSVSENREEAPVSRGQLQCGNNRFPPQVFLPQPTRTGDESRLLNRQMAFPQLVTTDLSRFQLQSPWQGLVPHTQPNKKQDTFPPDLNISFQSSGSPRQSSGAMVDSQQPDLALQL
ncbi:hypothetical protein IFM89_024017 [Coptis chinensis]|uniref:Bromo domain-containing protein n=1 Tax=Coptis chinensis TaxID=261450 RepID=A0A835H7J7_9MAGN|nr:hypothetical protein IFM89_024017 [Coptis chinensis]